MAYSNYQFFFTSQLSQQKMEMRFSRPGKGVGKKRKREIVREKAAYQCCNRAMKADVF